MVWNWTTLQFGILLVPSWTAKFTVLGLIVLAGLGAALLYQFVEEPARRWMRRMIEPKKPRANAPGRLQSVASARAG
jgi:peptidoglycan/LPS O-acetylase OafA/YrhL